MKHNLRQGMTVYSSDDHKLGKIVRCDAEEFIIEKGFFFPKDYLVRYQDVASIDGDDVRLAMPRDALLQTGETSGITGDRGVSTDMTGIPAESVRYVEAGDVERRTSHVPAHEEIEILKRPIPNAPAPRVVEQRAATERIDEEIDREKHAGEIPDDPDEDEELKKT